MRRVVVPVLAGVVIAACASVALVLSTGDRLTSSFGSRFLTYDSTQQLTGGSGSLWLVAGTVVLPGIGFSLAYRTAPARWRPAVASVCLGLFALDLVFLLSAVLWFAGTGHSADQLFGMSGDASGSGSIVFVLVMVIMTSAPLIMVWLSAGSDFDARSGEYFATGSARVSVTGIGVRLHAWFLFALSVLWLLVLVPVAVAAGSFGADSADPHARPWGSGHSGEVGSGLSGISLLFGLTAGLALSTLLGKLLHRGPWRARAARRPPHEPGRGRRLVVSLRHWPITLATAIAFVGTAAWLTSEDRFSDTTGIAVYAATIVVLSGSLTALGIWWQGMTWRVRDPRRPRQRTLRQALGRAG
ncbi:hypothetical protein [Amycolatopsis sp. NPDC098790]|uniref:hypothetical protein n=1 Tax=Amycolatopsis sp. NPDC098790 TaxID=3363939 RepID=UPI003818C3C1